MAVRIDEARVAGVVPAIGRQHFVGGFLVFVIALEQAGRLDHDLAVVSDLDFHTLARHAHGVSSRLVVRLQAHKHSGFCRAIQLLDVHADRAEKGEQIGANRLARGVGHTHAAETQVVAQGAENHQVTQAIHQTVHEADRLAVHQGRADFFGHAHEVVEQLALEAARVFHADHHAGQHALKHPGRCKVIRWADFFQVDGHRGR